MISKDIHQAAHLLYNDAIIAIPTETVYGLAGNIFSEKAIRSIFDLKKRPLSNPLIVHISNTHQLEGLVTEVPALAKKLMDKFWPGPLTLVLPKKDIVPNFVTGGKETVAVRMPNHKQTLKLLNLLPFPLAAPSANPFGSISPTEANHVSEYFGASIPFILEGGNCQKGIESTIIGFEDDVPVLYRLGSIALEDIENEIGPVNIKNFEENKPMAPGMMAKHYAPKTPTITTHKITEAIDFYKEKKIGLLLFNKTIESENIKHQEVLSFNSDLAEAASNLYAAMHRLDRLNLDIIIAEKFPESKLGRSINDRLKRATASANTAYIFN
nr:L-threonylcarbamoyladenylate synthase [uncultured Flavobacterium sp.]